MSDIISLNQINFNANTETQREIKLHTYLYSPGFTISQQFFNALGFQPIGNILLGFQSINKAAEDMGSYSIEKDDDVQKIDLNEKIDGKSQTVNRFNYYINALRSEKDLDEILDGLYDRNPDLVNSLQVIMENCAYGRYINFENLDYKSNKNSIADKLRSVQVLYSAPYLFYSKIGIPKQSDIFKFLPIKVFIQKDNFPSEQASFNKKCNEKTKVYYQMTFIIGSKGGIPVLILFSENCAICSADNSTKILNDYKEISDSIDCVYMIYYSINENLNTFQIPYENRTENSVSHSKINDETDGILNRYIKYKYETSWINTKKDFNFIELIQESIRYPFFFGICSGLSIEACYYGTVMLSYDSKSAENIKNSIPDTTESKSSNDFYTHYQTFTGFVLHLFEFLRELGYVKSRNDDYIIDDEGYQNIDNRCKSMFATIPPINNMVFDLFVDFIQKIIMSDTLPADIKNNFIEYFYNAVANFKDLKLEGKKLSTKTLNSLFKSEDNVSPSTVGEILMCYKCLKIPENLISKRIGIENYKQEYFKVSEYSNYLSATYMSAKIKL